MSELSKPTRPVSLALFVCVCVSSVIWATTSWADGGPYDNSGMWVRSDGDRDRWAVDLFSWTNMLYTDCQIYALDLHMNTNLIAIKKSC